MNTILSKKKLVRTCVINDFSTIEIFTYNTNLDTAVRIYYEKEEV